jgi:hypothetical protein
MKWGNIRFKTQTIRSDVSYIVEHHGAMPALTQTGRVRGCSIVCRKTVTARLPRCPRFDSGRRDLSNVRAKCPGSVGAYHAALSRLRHGFEFRPGRNPFLEPDSLYATIPERFSEPFQTLMNPYVSDQRPSRLIVVPFLENPCRYSRAPVVSACIPIMIMH